MKLLRSLDLLLSFQLGHAIAGSTNRQFAAVRRGHDESDKCPFTLSSSGSFACPAGQLNDGQIRLNGTYETSTFYYQKDGGGIIDAKGFGCIVTPAPTTQIQCDEGVAPDTGFSIDSSNNLLYHGSPNFYACPATDTEYNIYINPDFGQAKCFAVILQTDGCGTAPPTTTCPPASPSTVWQTQTEWITVNQTVTSVTTSACSSSSAIETTAWANSTVCHHCTKSASETTWSTV